MTREEIERLEETICFLSNVGQHVRSEAVKLAWQSLLDENKYLKQEINMSEDDVCHQAREIERLKNKCDRLKEKLDKAIYELGEPKPGSVVAMQEEIKRLKKWTNDLQAGMYINCVYCGHRYGPDSEVPAAMADVLKEHIESCPEHPMSELKREIERLKEEIDGGWRRAAEMDNDIKKRQAAVVEVAKEIEYAAIQDAMFVGSGVHNCRVPTEFISKLRKALVALKEDASGA